MTRESATEGKLEHPLIGDGASTREWESLSPLSNNADLAAGKLDVEWPNDWTLTDEQARHTPSEGLAPRGGASNPSMPRRRDRCAPWLRHGHRVGRISALVVADGAGTSTLCASLSGSLPPSKAGLFLGDREMLGFNPGARYSTHDLRRPAHRSRFPFRPDTDAVSQELSL
jgi:hypothetical protein